MIYLKKQDDVVIPVADLQIMESLYGPPDMTATDEEFYGAGGTAYIDASGAIVLGEPADVKSRREELQALAGEEAALLVELGAKDYKAIKASEAGLALADLDPELHERRDWCRSRINAIRARLAELGAGAS